MMFVCKTSDVNEAEQLPPVELFMKKLDLRSELLNIWGIVQVAKMRFSHKVRDMDVLMWYGSQHYSRKKRTPIMNINQLIADWTEVIVALSTSHDKASIDAAEFKTDELLAPLLAAPVNELREFHRGLTEALRNDKRVPFFVWSVFNAWGKHILEKVEAKPEAKRLRKKLANEIAEMVDDDVRKDIVSAITGALMWRDPENLKAIKGDLEAGAKPRLKGRESCLFLTTKRPGRKSVEHRVML